MAANSIHSPTPYDKLKRLCGITYAAQNIRSLIRKLDDIKLLLHHSNLDLLLLNETWLNSSIGDPELNIDGCTCHRFDRDAGSF